MNSVRSTGGAAGLGCLAARARGAGCSAGGSAALGAGAAAASGCSAGIAAVAAAGASCAGVSPSPAGFAARARVLPHLLRLTFQNALGKLVCHEYDLPAGDYSLRAPFPGIPRRIYFLLEVLFAYICANRTSRARTIITRRARAFRRQGTRSRRSLWSAGRRSRSARRPARSR